MTDATLLTDRARPAVRLERHLPDPPAVVWQALTEREQLRSWFPSDVVVEGGRWEIGAAITFPFPPEVIDMTLTGEVLEVDEPKVLAFTWGEETLRFDLSPEGDGRASSSSTSCRPARPRATPLAGRRASTASRVSTLPRTHGSRASSATPLCSNPRSARRKGLPPATRAASQSGRLGEPDFRSGDCGTSAGRRARSRRHNRGDDLRQQSRQATAARADPGDP